MSSIDEILAAGNPAFAGAVRAIITGDTGALRAALGADPGLIHARSASPHHAMLLHYVSANGIEPELHWTATPLHTAAIQGQTVVVDLLLRHGADPELKNARHQSTPAGWSQHARRPRRALAREVVALLDGHERAGRAA